MMYKEYKWMDVSFHGAYNRNMLTEVRDLKGAIPKTGSEHHSTYFRFNDEIVNHFEYKKSVSGFRGSCYADYLPIDIDDGDLDKAKESTLEVLRQLKKDEVNLEELKIYFSGSKGFHIMIPSKMFGIEPSKDLPLIFKKLVSELIFNVKLDMNIYQHTRLLRLPNTKNKKSGLYKIPLTAEELSELSIDEIKTMAKKERKKDHKSCEDIVAKLAKVYKTIITESEKKINKPQQDDEPGKESSDAAKWEARKLCYKAMEDDTVCANNRDNVALRLAVHYKKRNKSRSRAESLLADWNNDLEDPLRHEVILSKIKQAYENETYDYGCNDSVLMDYCDDNCYCLKKKEFNDELMQAEESKQSDKEDDYIYNIDDLRKKYMAYVKDLEKNRIDLGVEKLDEAIRGIAPGEVMQIIARSGVGKTAFMLNIIKNILSKGVPCIFFSLEMQAEQIFMRLNQITNKIGGIEVENAYKKDNVDKVYKPVEFDYKNITVIDKASLTLQTLRRMVSEAERKTGLTYGAIFVDYMGCMTTKQKGEYESISELAKGFKDLAKSFNKAIISLHQTNREGGSGEKEVTMAMARGSGVVEEAADQILTMYRPEIKNDDVQSEMYESVIIEIAKNRKGPKIKHTMQLEKNSLRFIENSERRKEEEELDRELQRIKRLKEKPNNHCIIKEDGTRIKCDARGNPRSDPFTPEFVIPENEYDYYTVVEVEEDIPVDDLDF